MTQERMTAAEYRRETSKSGTMKKSEQVARTFLQHIRARKLPTPRCKYTEGGELRFAAAEVNLPRQKQMKRQAAPMWKFDFAWPEQRIAVEIDGLVVRKVGGQTVTGGRHANVDGYRDDCEKLAWAAVLGWRVLRFEQSQVTRGFAVDMLVRLFAAMEPRLTVEPSPWRWTDAELAELMSRPHPPGINPRSGVLADQLLRGVEEVFERRAPHPQAGKYDVRVEVTPQDLERGAQCERCTDELNFAPEDPQR